LFITDASEGVKSVGGEAFAHPLFHWLAKSATGLNFLSKCVKKSRSPAQKSRSFSD